MNGYRENLTSLLSGPTLIPITKSSGLSLVLNDDLKLYCCLINKRHSNARAKDHRNASIVKRSFGKRKSKLRAVTESAPRNMTDYVQWEHLSPRLTTWISDAPNTGSLLQGTYSRWNAFSKNEWESGAPYFRETCRVSEDLRTLVKTGKEGERRNENKFSGTVTWKMKISFLCTVERQPGVETFI